ncbi:FAD-dependent oxidoreductase (plasmid) [Halorussus limi]|uniref:FAD-dependent oxidoreductase n=1 Tax=Halorussus limi TaxID=2938695 RepID=A0A8U0I0G9_9EURY|nr:FAD-dependent oxidoreductase [Halorussus limi]UPV76902.1 FAD-dependent oxidoreductase [Halorussus limi]
MGAESRYIGFEISVRHQRRHPGRHGPNRRAQGRYFQSIREGAYKNVEGNENIDFVEGHGVFESPHEVRVDDHTLSAERVVINTGARPAKPTIDGLNNVEVHDSIDLLDLDVIPDSLAVIGGGYVGCEYAQIYNRFASNVTVFQRGDRLPPPGRGPGGKRGHRDCLRRRRDHRPDQCTRDGTSRGRRRHPRRRQWYQHNHCLR